MSPESAPGTTVRLVQFTSILCAAKAHLYADVQMLLLPMPQRFCIQRRLKAQFLWIPKPDFAPQMDTNMRLLLLTLLLLPAQAYPEEWVALGETPEARVLLDQASVQTTGDEVMARLKFMYRKVQPAQTISQGSPFDSTINLYHLYCIAQKYQVLELSVLYKGKTVGAFHADPHPDNLDKPKLNSGVMLLIDRVCAGGNPTPAPKGISPGAN
jgi:hypothetical protein